MRAALVVMMFLAVSVPSAAAEGEGCIDVDQCIYLEATGHLVVGLLGVGLAPVNQAAHTVTPIDGYHKLRLAFEFSPDRMAFDTPAVEGELFYQFLAVIRDNATGEVLEEKTLRGSSAMSYFAPDESPVRIELTLTQGAAVTYALRVTALRDPIVVE